MHHQRTARAPGNLSRRACHEPPSAAVMNAKKPATCTGPNNISSPTTLVAMNFSVPGANRRRAALSSTSYHIWPTGPVK